MISSISDQVQDEGTALLTLTCAADSNPESNYNWVYPNGTESVGAELLLTALEIGDTGTYTCVVYNTFNGVNHTKNETTYIDVRKYSAGHSPVCYNVIWNHFHFEMAISMSVRALCNICSTLCKPIQKLVYTLNM